LITSPKRLLQQNLPIPTIRCFAAIFGFFLPLFDLLVGNEQQAQRHLDTEVACGLPVMKMIGASISASFSWA
jgi:hypothetical protein